MNLKRNDLLVIFTMGLLSSLLANYVYYSLKSGANVLKLVPDDVA